MSFKPDKVLLEKYRIEELVGRGAFAEVYRALHLKLNAPRALKVLQRNTPGLGSTEYSDFKARFKLEAQLGAKLNHPNIIQVHDFEQNGEDLILVMEYAAGGNLARRIEQVRENGKPIPIEEAVQIAIDVAEGLAVLHALDVVHRDLKPSNILFDNQGHAKVADLGLAQIPGGPSMRSQLSKPLPHAGTPAYMSPEQTNSTDYLTSASDIYALGLVLFETLTGHVYRSQRPGTRAGDLRKEVPAWLDNLLVKMLAEDPKERPWNGKDMAGLLHTRSPRAVKSEVRSSTVPDEINSMVNKKSASPKKESKVEQRPVRKKPTPKAADDKRVVEGVRSKRKITVDAVVITGGVSEPTDPLYSYSNGKSKALIDVAGKPMVQWVLDALSDANTIDHVVLVGLPNQVEVTCKKPLAHLVNHGKLLESLKAGTAKVVELNPRAKYVLFVSSDIPAITSTMIDWFVNTCYKTGDDLYFNVIRREDMEARFPNSKRTYTPLKDLEICGGNINMARTAIVNQNTDFWSQLIEARKNPAAQAVLIGTDIIFKFLFKQLTIDDVIKRVGDKLGLKGRVIICPYPEIGMNVDKPQQLLIIRANLARRTLPALSKKSTSRKKNLSNKRID